MKGRPRSVEREVAAYLTQILSDAGTPLVRIPVLGRTGPDITWNEVKLIVDVKSRKACPLGLLAGPGEELFTDNGLIGIRLEDLRSVLKKPLQAGPVTPASKTVTDWLNHMQEWTRANEPDGISAIILHRPRMPIGHATVIISYSNRSTLCKRLML